MSVLFLKSVRANCVNVTASVFIGLDALNATFGLRSLNNANRTIFYGANYPFDRRIHWLDYLGLTHDQNP